MPLYKDIWYASDDTPLNPSAISAAEATSTGNRLEKISSRLPIKVESQAERNELFPNPKAGDSVYRLDLGRQEVYYETYSAKNNIGGKPYSGWYLLNSGQNINSSVLSYAYTLPGTSNGLTVTRLLTSDFNFWQITYNLHSVSGGSGGVASTGWPRFCFAFGDTVNTTTNYIATQIGNNSATPVARTTSTNFFPLSYEAFTIPYIHSGTILLSGIASGDYPKILAQSSSNSPSSMAETSGYFNGTTTPLDGFRIFSSVNNLRGTISVRGFN
jgi:hypothetical protein